MIIDSHAHLSHIQSSSLQDLLKRARDAKISSIINICTEPKSLEEGLRLKEENDPKIYLAAATTPHDVAKQGLKDFPIFEDAAKKSQLIAIGETGLDYYYMHSPKEVQKAFLKRYLELAYQCQLPVIIHCRDAFDDFFAIIKQFPTVQGVLHCFTGTMQEAKTLIDLGWYLSFSGIVTFKKSQALREVAKIVPLNQMLVETDSPYLAPQEKRGQENEPAFIIHTAKTLASLKEIPYEDFCQISSQNSQKLFKLSN